MRTGMEPKKATGYRTERDPIGEKRVPLDVLYGIQTLRALENFQISNLRTDHSLITAFAEIKKAAARAHLKLNDLEDPIGESIVKATDEIIDGQWKDQFSLDVFQAGAGTSYNMNVNAVIANRALELLGRRRGEYEEIDPNDDVNKAQSTNDVMPTAMRIACIRGLRAVLAALTELEQSFSNQAAF
jgi:aspartate ammonia-lyase